MRDKDELNHLAGLGEDLTAAQLMLDGRLVLPGQTAKSWAEQSARHFLTKVPGSECHVEVELGKVVAKVVMPDGEHTTVRADEVPF